MLHCFFLRLLVLLMYVCTSVCVCGSLSYVESDSAVLLSSEPVSEEVPFLLVSLEESELGGASEEFFERLDPLDPLGLLPRRWG